MPVVREIMNKELFSVGPGDSVEAARNGVLALGITAAPVLDEGRCPIGVVSLRDLTDEPKTDTVQARMTAPAVVVHADESVDRVGQRLGESRRRHLVVVDTAGRAIGMVSAGDVLRSLMGLRPAHPPEFPDLEMRPQLTWDEGALDLDSVHDHAPSEPGILTLTIDRGQDRVLIWAEACDNVRGRLIDMLAMPQLMNPVLKSWMDRDLFHIRFRAAALPDAGERAQVARELRHDVRRF